MTEGQLYCCRNCGCEIKVIRASAEARGNPRCACGTPMKKPYRNPVLRELNSHAEVLTGLRTNRN